METSDLVLARGMRDTRAILVRWGRQPLPVIGGWAVASAAISLTLLAAVLVVASVVEPDLGFEYVPRTPDGPEAGHVLEVMGRNSLVLALHAFACVAGFIAGSSLPLSAAKKSGISRVIHERARPIAFAWVIAVTSFSLITQAFALGLTGSTLAHGLAIAPGQLILTALPHALLELIAVFLPLAAWTIASRRDEWGQLLAATIVTVTIAIPMLLVSAAWEVHVWPYILEAASPVT